MRRWQRGQRVYEDVWTKCFGSLRDVFEQGRSVLMCRVRACSYETEKEGIRDKRTLSWAGSKEDAPNASSPVIGRRWAN